MDKHDLLTIMQAAVLLCERPDLRFTNPDSARHYILSLRKHHGLKASAPAGRKRPLRVSRALLIKLVDNLGGDA